MSDHSHYEELAALEAGGFLSEAEEIELREHTKNCPECLKAEEQFNELVRSGLPLTVNRVREITDKIKAWPDNGIRSRFLQRAGLEGIAFSPDLKGSTWRPARRGGFILATATVLVTVLIVVVLHGIYRNSTSEEQAQEQVDRMKQENSTLTASLSQLNDSLAAGQREIQDLRSKLGNATTAAENLRRNTEQARREAELSTSRNAQLLEEARNQEQLLAQARDEAARISQLRLSDDASLVQQELRIADLSNKLRIASATLDMERQLAAAGKDVRELMLARQLHVVDVHDTGPSGKPSRAFGRVFLTEGKSLTFYAFDLNDDRVLKAKRSFEVWAVPEANKNSARSLGFLHADAKAQGRWVLKVEDPELVKDISSAFVTVEPEAGGKQPSGQKLLYAYLGVANHP